MAFVVATDMPYFGTIGGQSTRGKAPALYTYKTEDTHATVDGSGYFNKLANTLSIGDMILVEVVTNRGASNEAVSTVGWHVVNANASGVVDCTNVTAISVIDSD